MRKQRGKQEGNQRKTEEEELEELKKTRESKGIKKEIHWRKERKDNDNE